MTHLQAELNRLFLCDADNGQSALVRGQVGACGRVRALVLELARPANWQAISGVWRGVQTDLELPAPAIAVNGVDGYQLWFSVADPVSVSQAQAFLEGLCSKYLGDVAPARLGLMPSTNASAPTPLHLARMVPAQQPGTGFWSAFVAPDLAAILSDEPWLDLEPTPQAQAKSLARLVSMPLAVFHAVLAQVTTRAAVAQPAAVLPATAATALSSAAPVAAVGAAGAQTPDTSEPRRFLLSVMNDATVPLALRIEAARALL